MVAFIYDGIYDREIINSIFFSSKLRKSLKKENGVLLILETKTR